MRFILTISSALCVFLVGCAGSPVQLASASPEALISAKDRQLCNAYASTQDQEVGDEIYRRHLIRDEEWRLVNQNKIRIGMRKMALICSWGLPRDINRSVSEYGTREQWVYRPCRSCDATYVYLEDGKVRSWQN